MSKRELLTRDGRRLIIGWDPMFGRFYLETENGDRVTTPTVAALVRFLPDDSVDIELVEFLEDDLRFNR